MDISNKTLGLLLVAAIVVSVGGTLMSLNQLETISPTGLATTGSGTVTLAIESYVAIVVDDNTIDFGTCQLVSTGNTLFNSTLDDTAANGANNSLCSGGEILTFPSNITIRNSGTLDANLTFNASIAAGNANGTDMFGTAGSSWYYVFSEDAGDPCDDGTGVLTSAWTEVTGATTNNLAACTNFTIASKAGAPSSVLAFDFAAVVAPGSTNTDTLDLTFEAIAAS